MTTEQTNEPTRNDGERVLLTGATGFVGRHLYHALVRLGYQVVCASRNPTVARDRFPNRKWVSFDIDDEESVEAALSGVTRAVFLVHHLQTGRGYHEKEERAAFRFARAAEKQGLSRIVYLGGIEPRGPLSLHLRGRLLTGQILRGGSVPAVELRAGMIIGPGSASWNMVEDLASRLPAMVLPAWLSFRSRPIAIDDVVLALAASLSDDFADPGWYNIPGPEAVTHARMLRMAADVLGKRPLMFPVPILSPSLSSYWIAAVTRIRLPLAREIVQGLQADLVGEGPDFFDLIPGFRQTPLLEAMTRALREESADYPVASATARLRELAVRLFSPAT